MRLRTVEPALQVMLATAVAIARCGAGDWAGLVFRHRDGEFCAAIPDSTVPTLLNELIANIAAPSHEDETLDPHPPFEVRCQHWHAAFFSSPSVRRVGDQIVIAFVNDTKAVRVCAIDDRIAGHLRSQLQTLIVRH